MTTVVLNTVTREVEVFSSARDVQARAEIADHKAAADPHPQYLADADAADIALSGDAGDLTAGTVPDARMPNWTGYNVASRTALEATNVPAAVGALRLLGYTSIGDGGGALYKRVASEPSHAGKIQSADGAWWEIASRPIYVEMFGAVGDGATDDRGAIQAAIDTAEALGGGEVRFRVKTYALASLHPTFVGVATDYLILIRPGVYLIGAGRGATTIRRTAALAANMITFVNGDSGAGIRGMTITPDWPTILGGVGHGIVAENGELGPIHDVTIEDIEINNVASYGIGLQYGTLRRITIRNVFIDHCGADGIDLKNRNLSNSSIVLDGIFVNEHGIRSGLSAQAAIDIRGECTLSNIFCSWTDEGNTDKRGIRIRQNTGSAPITQLGGRRSSVTNFVVSASGALTSGEGLVIKHDNCHASNGWIGGAYGGVIVSAGACAVSNVSVESVADDGFRADTSADQCVFSACHTDGAGRFGFLLEGQDQQVIGGSAKNSTTAGIRLSSSTNARLIGVDLTSETTTVVTGTGTGTVGMLCPGWIGTGEITMGGHALVGDMTTYDEPITGRPYLHIGENIAGSTTANGELVLGHVSGAGSGDILGQISFYSSDESGTAKGRQAAIKGVTEHSAGVRSGLGFFTGTGSEDSGVERMRISYLGDVGIGETSPGYKLDVNGSFGFTPGASVTPVDNGDVVFELTNNTTLTVKAKGSDGVVRSGTIALA